MPNKMIYADNAATTQLDPVAFEAMKPYLLGEYGNASQPYSFSRSAKKAIKESRMIIASCIGAEPEEIFFTSCGTESDNWVIKGSAFCDEEKRATITSQIEHHAVLNACAAIERLGYPVAYLPVNEQGIVAPEKLEYFITDKTRLVSVMTANNEIGTIEPVQELASIAHSHGAVFHTDAVQAVGHIPIDVRKMNVDMLSASAHKFHGPKGIGFLYIKRGISISPLLDGGAQEGSLRAGTENVASIVGMATALKNSCDCISSEANRLQLLETELLSSLSQHGIDYIRNGSTNHLPGNINISIRGANGETILHRLDLKGICISTGSACDSVNTRISHVIHAIKTPPEYAKGTIRITLGASNSMEDVECISETLCAILR